MSEVPRGVKKRFAGDGKPNRTLGTGEPVPSGKVTAKHRYCVGAWERASARIRLSGEGDRGLWE